MIRHVNKLRSVSTRRAGTWLLVALMLPVHELGAGPTAGQPRYEFTYARVEEGQGYATVYFNFANRTDTPFTYTGYTPSGALLALQIRDYGTWRTVPEVICGTGLQSFTVAPGDRIEVARHVDLQYFHRELRVTMQDEDRPDESVRSASFWVRGTLDPHK